MMGLDVKSLVLEALRDPRRNAQRILALPLSKSSLYAALVVVGIVSTLALFAVAALSGVSLLGETMLPSPVLLVAMQIAVMVLLAGALRVLGQMVGGTGSFDGALRVIVWLQALMIVFQAVQLVAMIVLPPLAGILSLMSLAAIFYIAAGLIAGLHGFKSIWLTLIGTIVGLVVVALLISILLSVFLPPLPV